MPETLNVLYLAAEAEPFIKVGGLGDVAGALPRYLRNLSPDVTGGTSLDVRLALPLHPILRSSVHGLRAVALFGIPYRDRTLQVQVFATTLDGLPVYFVDGPPISSSGSVYSSDPALDGEKYAFFSLAALELTRQLDWHPNIVHANDWHSALACYALLLQRWEGQFPGVTSVITVHNLPFMGPDLAETLKDYGLMQVQTGLPEWANVRPLPLGLWASDAIVAVSPSYAREIQTPEYGVGLEDYLRARHDTLNGILNGLDYEAYNPALDPALASNYGIPTLERRSLNKAALQVRLGLPQAPDVPILAVVSRMDPQKGIDLIPRALHSLTTLDWQAVILGTGDPQVERGIQKMRSEFPDRVRVELKYDAGLARQIYAGSDLLLMPSRYEPCGLSQMIAMRYGCIPLVSAVGGLKDSVIEGETGFIITKPTATRLAAGIKSALTIYLDRPRWVEMQQSAMQQDFSWSVSAAQYFQLYQRALAQLTPH